MSSLSTPTRLGRGLIVPGIDTRPALDKVDTALSYGGLHTPPQSAHESRRPSLQYVGLSEGPFSASVYTHSQPVTPIHGLIHGNDIFSQRWQHSIEAQKGNTANVDEVCSSPPLDHSFQAAFEPVVSYNSSMLDNVPTYASIDPTNNVDNLALQPGSCSQMTDSWHQSHTVPGSYAAHSASLGPALFPIPHGMNVPVNSPSSVFDHVGQSVHSFNYQCPSNTNVYTTQGYGNPASLFQNPQVVVPSQVSPQEDYPDNHLSIYATPSRGHEKLDSSFSSESISFTEYEMVRPPSPMDGYFAHSEDEDFLLVKTEAMPTPVLGYSSRKSGEHPIRPKRRTSQRTRKTSGRTPFCRHEFHGCEIQCQGQKCCIGQPVKFEVAHSHKQYQCKFVENGQACGAKFDRSEHLKRHDGKHSNVRKYPCPLPSCKGKGVKIGRPDNAGDHFKTHLRPKKPGKRNDYYEWHVVHDAIWENYEDKRVAKKLLDGLSRWIHQGMPETSGIKRTRSKQ